MRRLLAPPAQVLVATERDIQDYSRVANDLSPDERLVWEIIGEGEPSRFPEIILLAQLTAEVLAAALEHIQASGSGGIALWPELPPFRSVVEERRVRSMYDLSGSQRQHTLEQWSRAENQQEILARTKLGIDASYEEFLVGATADADQLELALPAFLWARDQRRKPVGVEDVLVALRGVAERGEWAGRYCGPETNWCVFVGGAVQATHLQGLADSLPGANHRLLHVQDGEWRAVRSAGPSRPTT